MEGASRLRGKTLQCRLTASNFHATRFEAVRLVLT